ncbi:MAG: hypothetical protein WC935_00245 [Thermoleophilia bacterium]
MKSLNQYAFKRVAADGQVNGTSPCNVMAILLYGGAAATKAEFHNAVDATGTHMFECNTIIGQSHFIDFRELGGVYFSTACYVDLTGAGGVACVWYA